MNPERSKVPPPPGEFKSDLRLDAKETNDFRQAVAKGKQRCAEMAQSVADNKYLSDEQMAVRRKAFADHYKVGPPEAPYDTDAEASDIIVDGYPGAHYLNAVSVANAEIRAYANVNPTPPPTTWAALKSSDIQFLQYEQAHRHNPITPLARIRRMNVASGTGSATVRFMIILNPGLAGSTLTPGDPHQWQVAGQAGQITATTSDFFYAFLGTENAISSFWLVREHGRRLHINGIQKIVIESPQNVAIYFTHGN